MHSIVTTFRGAVIKVEVANFCAAMDTLIDQDEWYQEFDEYLYVKLTEWSSVKYLTWVWFLPVPCMPDEINITHNTYMYPHLLTSHPTFYE